MERTPQNEEIYLTNNGMGEGWETALEIYNTACIKVTGSIFSEIHAEEATTGILIVGSENATHIIKM